MAAPRAQPLFFGTLVNITDFRCRHPDSGCSAEEYAAADQLVFIRGGVFVRHDGNRRVLAEPTSALLFNRQQPYRVSHPHGGGDDCTVLAFAPGVCDAPFRATHARVPPATLLRVQSLRRRLRAGVASDLEAEETALEQLVAVLAATSDTENGKGEFEDSTTERRRHEMVEATKLTLASLPNARMSLSELARAVDCSPFHLSRIFRQRVGLPVYQYLLRLRLAVALDRIVEDGANLSALAFDLGFSSHSHLTTLFRRAFGVPPSMLKKTATGPLVRRLRRHASHRSSL